MIYSLTTKNPDPISLITKNKKTDTKSYVTKKNSHKSELKIITHYR